MKVDEIDFIANENKIKSSSLDELLEQVKDRKIKKKKFFCRVFHDLHYLRELSKEDYAKKLWTSCINEIQKSYEKIYWRHYYYFLYCFIFYNYTSAKYIDVEQAFREMIEEELDEHYEENTNYQFFRRNYPHLALFKALVDAIIFYDKLLEDKSLFGEIEDLELLEKRLDIKKRDIADKDGKIKMMYLTYHWNNPAKSHTTRVRNFGKHIYKQQEDAKDFSNYLARLIVEEYYRQKYYNSKLKIDDFIENQDIEKISRRTFFNYKKYFDERFEEGYFTKNTSEKGYARYLKELEKNPSIEINKALCKKLKVGQKALKAQIEKENNRI